MGREKIENPAHRIDVRRAQIATRADEIGLNQDLLVADGGQNLVLNVLEGLIDDVPPVVALDQANPGGRSRSRKQLPANHLRLVHLRLSQNHPAFDAPRPQGGRDRSSSKPAENLTTIDLPLPRHVSLLNLR